jgi:hypothetical protein
MSPATLLPFLCSTSKAFNSLLIVSLMISLLSPLLINLFVRSEQASAQSLAIFITFASVSAVFNLNEAQKFTIDSMKAFAFDLSLSLINFSTCCLTRKTSSSGIQIKPCAIVGFTIIP